MHKVQLGENNLVPLPDDLCAELGISIGDILICELIGDPSSITMKKYHDQTLSDDEIAAAGNLARVIPCDPIQKTPTL